ncbi:MAG: GGDEF domain-containing protein [Rubritepida sp.]|nr:GGDEF domain-containing protein [Rubritepida sp.]
MDHFKQVNDRHGHATGDAVLRCLAATLTAGLRGSDIICRYGGEEFLLLLTDCDLAGALARLDDLRRRVQAMQEGADSQLPGVTASFGVAPVLTSLDEAVRQADEALYAAKRGGRNRVVASPMLQQHQIIAVDELIPPTPAQQRLDGVAAMAGDDGRVG